MVKMTQTFTLDATIIVAVIGLFGTIYTTKMSTLTKMNEQLMELVEQSHEEIRELKLQHAAETERLENKISILTNENIELKNQVAELKFVLKNDEIKNNSK